MCINTSIMRKAVLLVATAFLFVISISAQNAQTAPIVWERYRLIDKKVSVLLPKLPLIFDRPDYCHELKRVSYYAYAEGAVYEVTLNSAFSDGGLIFGCNEQTKFGDRSLERRLDKLRESGDEPNETTSTRAGLDVYEFSGSGSTRWLISDIAKGKRWVELAVHYHPDDKPDFEKFFNSLDLATKNAKDIGKGATAMLGDPTPGTGESESSGDNPMRMVMRIFPSFPKGSLKKRVDGTVKLKVEFKANGSVGAITTITGMPHGLTEAAIDAARRTVFLPQTVDGVRTDTSITMDFGFRIEGSE